MTDAFPEQLRSLQRNYLKRLADYLPQWQRFERLLREGPIATADLRQFYRLSHNFAGSGTTFGFPQISHAASELNSALHAYCESDRIGESDFRRDALLDKMAAFIAICEAQCATDNCNSELG